MFRPIALGDAPDIYGYRGDSVIYALTRPSS